MKLVEAESSLASKQPDLLSSTGIGSIARKFSDSSVSQSF